MVISCVDPSCALYICIPANISTESVADSKHDTPLDTAAIQRNKIHVRA